MWILGLKGLIIQPPPSNQQSLLARTSLNTPQTELNFWFSLSMNQCQNPCSGPAPPGVPGIDYAP